MSKSKSVWIKNIETDLILVTPSLEKQYLYLAFTDYCYRQDKNKDEMVTPWQDKNKDEMVTPWQDKNKDEMVTP